MTKSPRTWAPGYYDPSVLVAIDYFNDNAGGSSLSGGFVTFAAGNDASSDSYYPAYYDGAIAVAGVQCRPMNKAHALCV